MTTKNLRYKKFWLMIGISMIVFVIYESLVSIPVVASLHISDKLMHITGYFGLMGWFVQIFQDRKCQFILAICFISMGIALEFIQGWGGVRQFEVVDMLANTTGVMFAWVLALTRFSTILLAVESVVSHQDIPRNK